MCQKPPGVANAHCSASYSVDPLHVSLGDELTEMAMSSQVHFEGKFESLDLVEFTQNQSWENKLFGQKPGPLAKKYPVATQLLIGSVTGWYMGFIFQKLARHTGYIKDGWQQVEEDVKKAKEQLKIRKNNQIPTRSRAKLRSQQPLYSIIGYRVLPPLFPCLPPSCGKSNGFYKNLLV
ncbi:FUN14 domain-containing protein 2 [Saguinus oedipus]|uniref:FUN14 domain-containing protein 2 n=1 Tax=Saguinus oedipus TaxID=9490 RepID=A0ABQ9VYL7_SAGOE|nr:FUN14 domain-containing protein 2 [Saguinus oedipus]